MSILTTGISAVERRLRSDLTQRLKCYLKDRRSTLKNLPIKKETLFNDIDDQNITRVMFDDALRTLEEENFLIATHQTIRLLYFE